MRRWRGGCESQIYQSKRDKVNEYFKLITLLIAKNDITRGPGMICENACAEYVVGSF
jgi:hypothetical protein